MMVGMRYDDSAQPALTRARPDAGDLEAMCPPAGPVPLDARAHFARRALLTRGLMAGTLDAADAVLLTRPAVELLGMLVPIDGLTERYLRRRDVEGLGITAPDFEHRRRELLAVVAAILDRWLGEDPGLWLGTVARAGTWHGSFPALIESVAGFEGDEDRGEPHRIPRGAMGTGRAPRWPRGVDASAVLLAMAPPPVQRRFLEACERSTSSRGILTRMIDRGPLVPALVDHVLENESQTAFDAYFRNPVFLAGALRDRVLREPADVKVLQETYLYDTADRALRIGCVRRADAAGGFEPSFIDRLMNPAWPRALREPLLASSDPQLLRRLLKRVDRRLSTPALLWTAYATLARAVGPEPVWALEQERAGRLEEMADVVRVSMVTGDIAPILAAADATPPTIGAPGSAMELGAPEIEPWPYTGLIREHVETSPHRKRAVGLLRAGTDQDAGLTATDRTEQRMGCRAAPP